MRIAITLTDEEIRLMADMVMDIEAWLQRGPLREKCENHKTRIANVMRTKLEQAGQLSNLNRDELVNLYFAEPGYRNRKQREENRAIEKFKQPTPEA